MVNSADDEKDRDQAKQGIQAGQTGEKAHSLQRGSGEDLGCEEEVTEEVIRQAVILELTDSFSPGGREERVIDEIEASIIADDVLNRIRLMIGKFKNSILQTLI